VSVEAIGVDMGWSFFAERIIKAKLNNSGCHSSPQTEMDGTRCKDGRGARDNGHCPWKTRGKKTGWKTPTALKRQHREGCAVAGWGSSRVVGDGAGPVGVEKTRGGGKGSTRSAASGVVE